MSCGMSLNSYGNKARPNPQNGIMLVELVDNHVLLWGLTLSDFNRAKNDPL